MTVNNEIHFKGKLITGPIYGLYSLDLIGDYTDLNNIKMPGMYSVGAIITAKTLKNMPEETAGILKVYTSNGCSHITGSYTYIKQEFYPYYCMSAYGRYIHTEATEDEWIYEDWVKMY